MDPVSRPPHATRRPLVLTLGAVLAAVTAFLLPAADAVLPGGSMAWQLSALALAVIGAWWGYRSTRTAAAAGAGARRGVRLLAAVAVLLVLVWVGGVALLWFIWPR